MVTVAYEQEFQKKASKIKNALLKQRLKKQIAKLLLFPEAGKPMRFGRKGTRELYVPPFRLSYHYFKEEDKIVILDLYHKDVQ